MYNDLVDINLTIVREFYSNFSHADQNTVYLRGRQIPIAENAIYYFLGINGDPVSKEGDAYEKNLIEKRTGRLDMDAVLGTIAAPGMWWDTSNPKSDRPLRHETTISMDTALLLYTLMSEGRIHLGRILNKSMYQATSEGKEESPESDLPQVNLPSIPPPIYVPQDQPTTSSAAIAPLAPTEAPSWTKLFKKLLKKLHRRKKDLRNTQYMIRTANPGMDFADLIPVSSSDSDNEDYN
ncbi:hypothetical protein PIB30_093680 [Stylosanthes scabra]|uniref:Putative plant transposon protein domain-containing protein n=1 Tax=Stylosanthes scabra TaxID=79078 RepID=A0ABU6SXJ9_9FABA|nr:hypothetical protein [Stylosanthes scabra]